MLEVELLKAIAKEAAEFEKTKPSAAFNCARHALAILEWRQTTLTFGRALRLTRLLINPKKRRRWKIIHVEVHDIELDGFYGKPILSIQVECPICGETQEAYGQEEASVAFACCRLRENCGNFHFYMEKLD